MSAAKVLLSRLDGVKEAGPGKWIARCCAHEDRKPSLSIREVEDRVLVHCAELLLKGYTNAGGRPRRVHSAAHAAFLARAGTITLPK